MEGHSPDSQTEDTMKMPQTQLVTETIIVQPKKSIILKNVADSARNHAAEAFVKLTNIVQGQNGLIRQFCVIIPFQKPFDVNAEYHRATKLKIHIYLSGQLVGIKGNAAIVST